jgi:hypothetical protein
MVSNMELDIEENPAEKPNSSQSKIEKLESIL